MSTQNIIFDVGGVLVEWNPQRIIDTFTQDQELAAKIRSGVFEHPDWDEKDRGVISKDELNRRFARNTGLSETEIASLMRIVVDTLPLKPETLPLMDELRQLGYRLFCLSNMPVDHFDHLKKIFDFWEKFDGIVISGQVKLVKPEAEIYRYLLEAFSLEPSTCIFLDDSPKNIAAAQKVGIRGIVFRDVDSSREELRNKYNVGK